MLGHFNNALFDVLRSARYRACPDGCCSFVAGIYLSRWKLISPGLLLGRQASALRMFLIGKFMA